MVSQIPTTFSGVQSKFVDSSKNLLKDVKNPLDSLKSNRYKQSENVKNNPLQIHSNFILEAMEKTSCVKISKRWQLALLSNIGFLIVFGIRCNFGAAKNRMAKNYTDPWGNHHVTLINLLFIY